MIVLVNNTSADLRPFYTAILDSLRNTGRLPDEFSDVFVATKINGNRWRIDFA